MCSSPLRTERSTNAQIEMPVALARARQQISEPPIPQVHAVDTTEIGRLSAALADRYVIERELGRGRNGHRLPRA